MKYYKNKYVKVLENWETDYGDLRFRAILYENGKAKAYIIASYDEDIENVEDLIYKDFDKYLELPKISKCSKLLQKSTIMSVNHLRQCVILQKMNGKIITKIFLMK